MHFDILSVLKFERKNKNKENLHQKGRGGRRARDVFFLFLVDNQIVSFLFSPFFGTKKTNKKYSKFNLHYRKKQHKAATLFICFLSSVSILKWLSFFSFFLLVDIIFFRKQPDRRE